MLKKLTHSRFGIAVIVIASIFLVIFAGATGLPQSAYNPQWELRTAIVGLQNSPETPNWEALASLGDVNRDGSVTQADVDLVVKALDSRPGDSKWNPACDLNGNGVVDIYDLTTTTGHVGYSMYQGIYETSGTKVRHDFDVATWGLPDIEVTVSDVRKKDMEPFANITVEGFDYELESVEYLFDVKFRTIADAVREVGDSTTWLHETAMGFEWKTNIIGTGGSRIGQEFSGGAYVKYSCNPWGMEDYGVNTATFKRFWYALMNMKVESVAMGQVENVGGAIPENEIQHKGWGKGLATAGDQLNMIPENPKLGGVYSPVPWDPQKILDPDMRSSAIVYLPVDMFAGAKDTYDQWFNSGLGGITNVLPIDYYVIYTVRVETCLVREFEGPIINPDPSPLNPPIDYTPYTPTTFWDKYGTWIIIAVIAIIVLALVFAWLFGGSILMMGMWR